MIVKFAMMLKFVVMNASASSPHHDRPDRGETGLACLCVARARGEGHPLVCRCVAWARGADLPWVCRCVAWVEVVHLPSAYHRGKAEVSALRSLASFLSSFAIEE